MSQKKQIKGRYANIEINSNYDEFKDWLKSLPYEYLIIGGFEEGPHHMYNPEKYPVNKHYHAFIDFGKQVGQSRYRKKVASHGDWKACNYGTTDACRDYVIKLEKEEEFEDDGKKIKAVFKVKEPYGNQMIDFEDGEFESLGIGSGARNDLKKKLEENDYNRDKIARDDPVLYSRYAKGIDKVCQIEEQLRNYDKWCGADGAEVEYHLGTSRCGKTYALKQICKATKKEGQSTWILGHLNDSFYKIIGRSDESSEPEVIVLNEYRDSKMPLDTFLELLEGIGTLPAKGGDINCIGIKKVYIASIIPPWELYKNSKRSEDVESQLKGRIGDNLYFHDRDEDGFYITKKIKWREFEIKKWMDETDIAELN